MKTTISFLSFVAASILAGIGCEDQNNLALLAGCVFMILTILVVFIPEQTEKN
jgi:uncharacterized membrane protein YkvI